MTPEFVPISSFNRKALTGFLLSLLAVLALCAGVFPLPFAELICFPPGLVLSVAALIVGSLALRETKTDGMNGRSLAWFAVWSGGIVLVAMLCVATASMLMFPYISEFIKENMNRIRP